MDITIQQIDFSRDRAVVAALLCELQSVEQTIRPQRDDWTHMGDGYMASLVDEISHKDGACFVANVKDNQAGLICGWVEQADTPAMDQDEKDYGYISDVIVSEDYRHQGVFQKMLGHMEQFFKNRNIQHIRLHVLAGNHRMTECVSKNGYAPYYTSFEKKIG